MDVTKIAYARVKLVGVKEPILFNDGDKSLERLLQYIGVWLKLSPHTARAGIHRMDFSFDGPMSVEDVKESPEEEAAMERLLASAVDWSDIYEPGSLDERHAIFMMDHPQKPLLVEYRLFSILKNRMTKTDEYVKAVKLKVETEFADQEELVMHGYGGKFWQY